MVKCNTKPRKARLMLLRFLALLRNYQQGYVDLWDSFVGKEDMYARDSLHLSGKGAAVFDEGLSGAGASGLGKVRYLN